MVKVLCCRHRHTQWGGGAKPKVWCLLARETTGAPTLLRTFFCGSEMMEFFEMVSKTCPTMKKQDNLGAFQGPKD